MPFTQHIHANHLLAAVTPAEAERMAPHLKKVELPLGQILHEPDGDVHYVYFPTTAIISLHYVTETGATSEIASVGNEGLVGFEVITGGDTTPTSAVVSTAGQAFRLPSMLLKEEFARCGQVQGLLLRYMQALMAQVSQTGICNRFHSVEQQLCRWLLVTLDRIPSGELVVTQELIASMIGVRREGITEAAGKLQNAGYIRYRRGRISVLDRSGLESQACECYAVVRREMRRLLPVWAENLDETPRHSMAAERRRAASYQYESATRTRP